MTKKYENPMLQIVSIKMNDIVTSSPTVPVDPTNSYDPNAGGIYAPGQRGLFDSYDAGY